MPLTLVPPKPEIAHTAVCSIDGEPWPCQHQRQLGRIIHLAHVGVRCLACGHLRNAWTALNIDAGFDGRPVYFHARARCIAKARQWWEENVKPHTDQEFTQGEYIFDVHRYISVRTGLKAVPGQP